MSGATASASRIVLAGGTVVDGTGGARRVADVVIDGSKIHEITAGGTDLYGAEVVDCDGLIVAPGFIDIHTHSDLTRLYYPQAETRVAQGITTEVTGNCGMSPFPVPDDPAELRSIIGPIDVCPELEITWSSLAEYLELLEKTPGGTNVAPLIGHGSLRQWAMGSKNLMATPQDLERMREELARSLEAGAWGMSFGLMYAPGELADRRELSILSSQVARDGGFVSAHMRSYAAEGLLGSIKEIADVVRDSGVGFEISHLRSLGDENAAKMSEALDYLAKSGLDIEADAYPYLAGHTTLLQLFPPEIRGLGTDALLAYVLRDPERAANALRSMSGNGGEAITIAKASVDGYQGLTLQEAAERDGTDWAQLAVELVIRSRGAVDVIVVGSTSEDTMRSLAHPAVSIASDGVSLSLSHSANLPHPRSIGTFPRAIAELLEHGLPIEAVIHKATGKPARRMGLRNRGTLAAGNVADVVVLDVASLRDNASYTNPLVPPSGVQQVMVNGEFVLKDTRFTGRLPGVLLRKPQPRV